MQKRHAFLAAGVVLIAGCFKDEDHQASNTNTANTAPEITGTALAEVTLGRAYGFTPSATDADGDALTFEITNKPAWATFDSTVGRLSGKPTEADVGVHENIVIGVTDGKAAAHLPPFSVVVTPISDGSATLSWQPPTQHEDGSPLNTLAGYRVIYGTSADDLSESDKLGNPGLTRYTVTNLSAATWHFAVVAYTTNGLESRLSSVVSTSIQ